MLHLWWGHQTPIFCNNEEGEEGNKSLKSPDNWILQISEWPWYFVIYLSAAEGEEGYKPATYNLTIIQILHKTSIRFVSWHAILNM